MSNFGNLADRWLGTQSPNPQRGNTEVRGYDTARLINAKPTTMVITRRNPDTGKIEQMPPQTLRIDVLQNSRQANELTDVALAISKQYVVITGYKDCPGIPNTNILRADRFFFGELMYEVEDFIDTVPGRLLATASLKP